MNIFGFEITRSGRAKASDVDNAAVRALISTSTRSLKGGRASVDTVESVFTSSLNILSPLAPDDYWRNYGLDSRTLDRVSTTKLVELLIDLSPDVSKGAWDFLRLFNPGYECKVFELDGEDIHAEGQRATDAFLKSLHGCYSSTNNIPADIVINTLSLSAFLRGGMFAELVPDKKGKMPLEIATPDPATIRFQQREDPERGKVWQLGQHQKGQFVALDRPTIVYVPIDPLPGKPYGRPLVHPAIFATLFLIGLLHDLRRVVAQQGYPRIDLIVDFEELKKLMPANLASDPKAMQKWFAKTFQEIEDGYAALEPDDAYVHSGAVKVNGPVGAMGTTHLGGMEGLIKALERMLTKALKTMPLFMAAESSGNQTNSNRQWEIQAAGIKSIQHPAEFILEKLLTLGLQMQGILARVQFRFAELRAAEMLRDEQVQFLKLRNAREAYENGLISQDEQAQMALGKATADVKEPRRVQSNAGGQVASINADPGSNRSNAHQRNAHSLALLVSADALPQDDEIDADIEFFNQAVPDATDVLEPELVN